MAGIFRLLHVTTLSFKEFLGNAKRPKYAIASHRWADDEATYKEVAKARNTDKAGRQKVEGFAKYIRDNFPSIEWFWIDTCCINKNDAVELSYAINSMFKWYREAELCVAYLADVRRTNDKTGFSNSQWFQRGWTLQELLAPRIVIFTTCQWEAIGRKGTFFSNEVMPDLVEEIKQVTGLPESVLVDYYASTNISVEEKISWMDNRNTTVEEDQSYALFGILGVTPGANYGEGHHEARRRLKEAILQQNEARTRQAEDFRAIVRWLSPPDPWTNHETARSLHERETGTWLLDSTHYREWKYGSTRYLWLYGKPGSGKTVLCSTTITDMQAYCQTQANIGHAMFYFSFSDKQKQSYRDLVTSLVAQLASKDPGLSMLRRAYQSSTRTSLGTNEIQDVLLASADSFEKIFLHLDGLDECPEGHQGRQKTLQNIHELLETAPNIRVIVTSRDLPDIRRCMNELNATIVPFTSEAVGYDIQRYVSTQLRSSQKLSRLDNKTKRLIEKTLIQKADGMFRWVYCQIELLSKSKSTSPAAIERALNNLPATLDATYDRILTGIAEEDQSLAKTFIRWIAYAGRPLTLAQLMEASVIIVPDDPADDGIVEVQHRGQCQDVLDLLAGLVIIVEVQDSAFFDDEGYLEEDHNGNDVVFGVPVDKVSYEEISFGEDHDDSTDIPEFRPKPYARIQLAHFSIKEYLESDRIRHNPAHYFQLDPAREHRHITQSCLVYIMHYSRFFTKSMNRRDLIAFPLLHYTSRMWYEHARQQQWTGTIREFKFLNSADIMRSWTMIHDPDDQFHVPFGSPRTAPCSVLYYSSMFGFTTMVKELVDAGFDIETRGGYYGNALQISSRCGRADVVRILIEAGADIIARNSFHESALQLASANGQLEIVRILLEAMANINPRTEHYGCALRAASEKGHERIVSMLIKAGADVNMSGGRLENALKIASALGKKEVVRILIQAGADVNMGVGHFGGPLQTATSFGNADVVQMLIDAGADVNNKAGDFGSALQAALGIGQKDIILMLIHSGADVNLEGGIYGTALQAAAAKGQEDIVRILIDAGADVNMEGGKYGSALQAASIYGKTETIRILLDAGADVNMKTEQYRSALEIASRLGSKDIVQLLLQAGAKR